VGEESSERANFPRLNAINNLMNIQIQLPKIQLGAVRAGVRPGKVEQSDKVKQKNQRHPKHRKNWKFCSE
jgi:hypothetical protein